MLERVNFTVCKMYLDLKKKKGSRWCSAYKIPIEYQFMLKHKKEYASTKLNERKARESFMKMRDSGSPIKVLMALFLRCISEP